MQENQSSFFQKYKTLLIVLAVLALLVMWSISFYNGFVSQNVAIDAQWSQVENQLQRRFDLIPNLVSTVKGVANQEQQVFGDIAEARTRYSGASSQNDKALAAGQLESALGRLLVITENYPTLQSSQSFRDLMVQLEGTENRISTERMKYNDQVKNLNSGIKRFPGMIFASLFGIEERAYFEVTEQAKENPKVDFVN